MTFPRVRISGGIYGGRVQMSSQTQTPRVARIGLAVSTPGCEPSQAYSRPVILQMSAGRTFFAGFRPVRTLDPLSKCEEPSQVPFSRLAQWDAGLYPAGRRRLELQDERDAPGMLHAGAAFEGASTMLFKRPATPSHLPFPLDRLWTGRSFVISGQTTKTAKFFEGASMKTSVRLTFTRRR